MIKMSKSIPVSPDDRWIGDDRGNTEIDKNSKNYNIQRIAQKNSYFFKVYKRKKPTQKLLYASADTITKTTLEPIDGGVLRPLNVVDQREFADFCHGRIQCLLVDGQLVQPRSGFCDIRADHVGLNGMRIGLKRRRRIRCGLQRLCMRA